MADLEFYQDDSDENAEDGFGLDDGLGEVEDLTPLQRLEKYLDSDNIFNRQMLARGLLDTLRAVYETNDNCMAVLDAMAKLSEDPEPSVRSELMEQVPHIAVYCQENNQAFTNAVPQYILPMVVRYLNDSNSQVRKTSQAALLVLLEQELVEKGDTEKQVVHVILELASPESMDDYRSEAAALMSKMAPLLGKDITERQFLPRFSELCTDPLFHVRKTCAANFGEVASVVGEVNCEEVLLPKFFYLCEDGVWGVRKACAECFMTVSCACSLETRRNELANLYVNLLCDQSRWVRMSAFQQLGPFISTFADAERTGLFVNEDGSLSFRSMESFDSEVDEVKDHDTLLTLCSSSQDDGCKEERDLTGILQLQSLDPAGTPTESDTDAPESNVGNISNNSERVDEEMEVGDALEEQEEEMKLVCDLDISAEELRAEAVVGAGSSVDGDLSIDKPATSEHNVAQNSSCDSCGAGETESIQTSQSFVECSTSPASSEKDVDNGGGDGVKTDQHVAVEGSGSVNNPICSSSSVLESAKDMEPALSSDGSDDPAQNFNAFQYWRPPLPEVEIDFDLVNKQPTNIYFVPKVKDDKNAVTEMSNTDSEAIRDSMSKLTVNTSGENRGPAGRIHTARVNTVSDAAEETVSNIGSTHVLGQHLGEQHLAVVDGIVQDLSGSSLSFMDEAPSLEFGLDDATLAQQQNIVPQLLLENYLGMVDPSRAQTVDGEITRHCAYNLPAVAYTLGRKNWHCIKQLYETLAQDMQWKVRRTLAFSMHELAMIVGDEITHKDLVPVFDGFLKDLDEVRIGVLKHLAHIFRLLRPDVRLQYLGRVQDFMKTDNTRNWRFREELALQLIDICELFHCVDIVEHIVPLATVLCLDKVAQVRFMALRLLSSILRRTYLDEEKKLLASICNDVIERFATSISWLGRQTFAQLCYVILEEDSLPPDVFARNFLPSLLTMGEDSVANVRLSVAKVMTQRITPLDYFTSQQNPYHQDLVSTQQGLQSDKDKDVRYFSSQHPSTDIDHDLQHHMVSTLSQSNPELKIKKTAI